MRKLLLSFAIVATAWIGHSASALAVNDVAPCVNLDQYGSSGEISNGSTCKADKSNKKLVIDFFATWCGYCQAYLPTFEGIAAQYSDKAEFRIVGLDDNADDVKKYFKDRDLSHYNIALDPDGKSVEPFDIKGIPTTVVIDSDGKVLLIHVGTVDTPEEKQAIIDAINR